MCTHTQVPPFEMSTLTMASYPLLVKKVRLDLLGVKGHAGVKVLRGYSFHQKAFHQHLPQDQVFGRFFMIFEVKKISKFWKNWEKCFSQKSPNFCLKN